MKSKMKNNSSVRTLILIDGATYVGEVKFGKPNGYGTWTNLQGETYVGEYRNGKRHGQGTATSPTGHSHVGEWRYDLQHGQGSCTFPDGSKFEGKFKRCKFNGRGTFIFSDGSKIEGIFRNHEPIRGTFTAPDGTTEEFNGRSLFAMNKHYQKSIQDPIPADQVRENHQKFVKNLISKVHVRLETGIEGCVMYVPECAAKQLRNNSDPNNPFTL